MKNSKFSQRHPDDDIFDKDTPFNEMEIYLIKMGYAKLEKYAQTHWQDPKIKPYAQQQLSLIKREIDAGLKKPATKRIRVSLFTRYFMEYGWQDCELYVSLVACTRRLVEGHKRIFHEDNFHNKLSQYELDFPAS